MSVSLHHHVSLHHSTSPPHSPSLSQPTSPPHPPPVNQCTSPPHPPPVSQSTSPHQSTSPPHSPSVSQSTPPPDTVMCAPSSQVVTTLENVDNVITVRISRENLDSENHLKQCRGGKVKQCPLNMKAFSNLEFGLIKT